MTADQGSARPGADGSGVAGGHEGDRTSESWVTGPNGPLWTATHRPHGSEVNGIAVIAGSIGLEAVTMHRAMFRLGHELSRRGIVAVRFAWTGDGDSAPLPPGTDPAAAWAGDLGAVVEHARGLAPGAPLHLVATRLGTTIDPGVPVDSLTQIEPVAGRAFVRAHMMLRKLGTPVDLVPDDLGVELSGTLWSGEQASAVRRLKPLASLSGHPARQVEISPEQLETFYSVAPQLAEVPLEPLVALADSLVGTTSVPLAPEAPQRLAELVVDGVRVQEELVRIGPDALPGVITRPVEGDVVNAVAFTAPGAESRSAPVGLFATLPRILASRGSLSVRADRRGLGELASTTELHAPNVYSLAAVDDVAACIDAARDAAPGVPVVAVGACVGAWLFQRSAARTHPARLVALDSIAWDTDPESYQWIPGTYEVAYGGKRIAAGLRTPPGMGKQSLRRRVAVRAFGVAKRVAARTLAVAVRMSPAWAWHVLAERKIVQDPLPMLLSIPEDTRLDLHAGPFAASIFERSRGIQSVRTARAQGRHVTMSRWPDFDHSIFAAKARSTAVDIVLDAARRTR